MTPSRTGAGNACDSAKRWPLGALVLVLCLATGIALRGNGSPEMAPVFGRVTLDGLPLSTGTVGFVPDLAKGTRGVMATGLVEPDGTYRLKTGVAGSSRDGVVAGWYKVRVQARRPFPDGEIWASGAAASLIPEDYDDPDRSGLAFDVKPGRANWIDLELVSTH